MQSRTALLMFTLLLIMQDARGFFGNPYCERCHCLKTTKLFINPKNISSIRVFPSTLCCPVELILLLKNGQIVCVDPAAKWINTLMDIIQKKKKNENPSA
uniref:C-X-C motif chemokine 13 isoform X2 n=1 Tax=Geotrypetes seraphini TaxID=260995 RepID=A0A6P8R9F7_GEOSA|nr:C-X-C motif chemokine 13 isoform X2 [Geotrypetes seraphini]